jgi:hypothetical protein
VLVNVAQKWRKKNGYGMLFFLRLAVDNLNENSTSGSDFDEIDIIF